MTDTVEPVQAAELAALKQEVAVLIRLLEEAGVRFNRDGDGRVCGLVRDAEATIVGEGEAGN